MSRISFDEYFLDIAQAIAARADCRRAKHGCVLVKDHRIIATGYNGSPKGGPSCLAGECPRGLKTYEELASCTGGYNDCIAVHNLVNAVVYAREDCKGATSYETGPQCPDCRKVTLAAGIIRVVWPDGEWNA